MLHCPRPLTDTPCDADRAPAARSRFSRGAVALPLMLGLWLLLAAAPVQAQDAVKMAGFWIENVEVRTIDQGIISYITNTGQAVEQPLTRLEGLRMRRYPGLATAQTALEENRPADAVQPLGEVVRTARENWVKAYAHWKLAGIHNDLGQAVPAAEAYLALAAVEADAYFWDNPPTRAVEGASAAQKQQILATLGPLLERTRDEHRRAALQSLLEAAQKPAPDTGDAVAAGEGAPAAPQGGGSAAAESAVLLPAGIEPDPISNHLRAGEFNDALTKANLVLQTPQEISRNLYLRGMAQLGLAEANGNEAGYKDAGLSFVRVLAYFPNSRYAGPALVELGHVHATIGRHDLARSLYDRARLQIDEETDPAYHARLIELINALP